MPDISMCADNECPVRTKCYRHQASGTQPSGWQSYAGFKATSDEGCDHFCTRKYKEPVK